MPWPGWSQLFLRFPNPLSIIIFVIIIIISSSSSSSSICGYIEFFPGSLHKTFLGLYPRLRMRKDSEYIYSTFMCLATSLGDIFGHIHFFERSLLTSSSQ